jgi:hypothetical protein
VTLQPHRAAYHLSLSGHDRGSSVAAAYGALVNELQESCEGWISTQRLAFTGTDGEGGEFAFDVRTTSVESLDGRHMRFDVRTFEGETLTEQYRGRARAEPGNGPGSVTFSQPRGDQIELPAGTIFPTTHLLKVIAAAQDGQGLFIATVFDGAGEDGLNEVSAFLGKAGKDDNGHTWWPVDLAYYPADAEDMVPDFELSLELADNGVIRSIVLDYGDFALAGELDSLEMLPAESCD